MGRGYNGDNGWAIGERREYQDDKTRDEADALALYATLESEIVPLFYDRGADDLPHDWVAVMTRGDSDGGARPSACAGW